ncbi:MAG TPA: DUF1254 domain-containing protein [Chitinophagaceae bacterium]
MKKICFVFILVTMIAACNQTSQTNTLAESSKTSDEATALFKPANTNEQAIYSRAFNAVVWGMPAVNSELMHESLLHANCDYNQVVYWSGRVNDKNQTLTPNPDVIYVNPYYDTRKGPVVLEIPAAEGVSSITGSIDDAWQTAIEDVGPAGVDKGKGGKYLILPPGYKDKIPARYIPMPSSIYTGFVILRSNLTDGSKEDLARAVEYGKKVKIYPYAERDNPQVKYIDLLQTPFSNVIPYNLHFFEALNSFVQREPWLTRDMAMTDQLRTIGIEKGKPFNPDERTKEILNAAVIDAGKWLDEKYEEIFKQTSFYERTHWLLPVDIKFMEALMANYPDPNYYPTDSRGVAYTMAYFSTKHLGSGQYYLMTIKDKNENALDGSKTYQLHLPPNVPVKLYWSVTAYDRQTHALIKGMAHSSRSSNTAGLQKNADGSVDIYFGAKAPAGKESNWVPTDAKGKFELLARFYGPENGFFDKTWKMDDVEEVK